VPLHKWENVSESETIPYPSAMKSQESLDFSFAGSYFYTLQHLYPRSHYLPLTSPLLDPCFHRSNPKTAEILINSFQAAVEEQVSDRVTKALRYVKENHPIVKTFVRPKQAFTGGISSNQRLSLKLKELCNAFDFHYMQKNEKDSIEMIRDLIFFKKCNLLNPQNLSAYKNYALGPYTFLTL
jgi:tRNA A37 threonylcarbamoyltransferase TsaD